LKAWPVLAIGFIQALLLLAHWFIFHTWIVFCGNLINPSLALELHDTLFVLAFSFIVAALLGFRFSNMFVTVIYRLAATWLGFLNFFFYAACLCWLVDLPLRLMSLPQHRPLIAIALFTLALLAGIYGLFNALWIRVRRVTVKLPNLPAPWRERTAVLLSDLHLGNVNGTKFSRRVARLVARQNPDIVFLPGDFFDGTRMDPNTLAAPFLKLAPPLGIYFSTGNHDEFGDLPRCLQALTRAGIRILSNQMVTIDGLQILGIPYHDSTSILRMRANLDALHLDPTQPSILLNHVPNRLPIVEQAGISLQLSGHTHGGQLFPFTWMTRRAFGKFTYGLHKFGSLQVYTSYGAGTWGPPMRVGTHPEIVLLTFQ